MTNRLSSQPALLKAKFILPMAGPPIVNGGLLLRDGRIEATLSEQQVAAQLGGAELRLFDLAQSIVSPGFINAHTHLDYSLLQGHNASANFIAWIKSLQETSRSWDPDTWQHSAAAGVKAAAATGTTCLVDNSYAGVSAQSISEAGLRALLGLELFGVNEETALAEWTRWLAKRQKLIESASPKLAADLASQKIRLTVSAHAPYTVCPALWTLAKQWALENEQIVLAHAAESENERRWFASDDAELNELLTFSFGRIPDYKGDPVSCTKTWRKGGHSPVEHLDFYKLLSDKLLVAHAVQISASDAQLLAKHGVSVAHCPRSNSRLRNGVAPIDLYRRNRLKFGLGTDSLASADSLDMLDEARFAVAVQRALYPSSTFGAQQALEAITIEAARAIHMDTEIGSLVAGKRADFAVFAFAENEKASDLATKNDPYDLLLHGQCRLSSLFVDAQQVLGVPLEWERPNSEPAKV